MQVSGVLTPWLNMSCYQISGSEKGSGFPSARSVENPRASVAAQRAANAKAEGSVPGDLGLFSAS